jgi:hypothetical protein
MLVLFVPPTASTLIDPPLSLAQPVGVPKAASSPSLYASATAVLLILTDVVPNVPPTWMLPRLTGVVIVLAAA